MADNIERRGLRPRYEEFGGTSAGARNRYYRSDSGAGVSKLSTQATCIAPGGGAAVGSVG
jgi:hypothetical protein